MIKVILLIDCASEHDRRLLRGMTRYFKENGSWMFHLVSPGFRFEDNREEWAIQWAHQWKADAIIGRWDECKISLLDQLDIPVVLQNNKSRSGVFSNITGDYDKTGRMAAQYFRKKLFTDFAFFGVKDIIWSEERCKGYEDEVIKNKGRFYCYAEALMGDDRDSIIRWLKSLPKPIALFCCDDAHAIYITETCKMAGIRIPQDISILGVDDDDLLCSISDPPISSIEMDVENGGYQCCKLLHACLLSGSKKQFDVTISPLGINERQSTSIRNIQDKEVFKLLNYIDDNFSQDIKMSELLSMVALSRRSIEVRFKKATGQTIYQYLLDVRIEHFAYLLRTTDRHYMDIAYEVGFHDLTNVTRTFRRHMGCTPNEYREQAKHR